jgi:hypothetical protein
LRRESEAFDTLKPGEDMVGLEKAFAAAEEDYRPGDAAVKKEPKDAKEPKEAKPKKESKKK